MMTWQWFESFLYHSYYHEAPMSYMYTPSTTILPHTLIAYEHQCMRYMYTAHVRVWYMHTCTYLVCHIGPQEDIDKEDHTEHAQSRHQQTYTHRVDTTPAVNTYMHNQYIIVRT